MTRVMLAVTLVIGMTAFAAADDKDKDPPKGELLKKILDVTVEFDKDKKKLTINAIGQVNTGGWKGAALVRKETKEAPKDGIYQYEMTAIRPTGIVPQIVSKVKATDIWESPPADLKGIKVLGVGEGAKTVMVEK